MSLKAVFVGRSVADIERLEAYAKFLSIEGDYNFDGTFLVIPDDNRFQVSCRNFNWRRIDEFVFGFEHGFLLRLLKKFKLLSRFLIREKEYNMIFRDYKFDGLYHVVCHVLAKKASFKFVVPHGTGNTFHLMHHEFILPSCRGWLHIVNSEVESAAIKGDSIVFGDILYRKDEISKVSEFSENIVFVESGDISHLVNFDHVSAFYNMALEFIATSKHPYRYCGHPRNIRETTPIQISYYETQRHIETAQIVVMDGFSSLNVDVHFNNVLCAIYCPSRDLDSYYLKLKSYGFFIFSSMEELKYILMNVDTLSSSYNEDMCRLYHFRDLDFLNLINNCVREK